MFFLGGEGVVKEEKNLVLLCARIFKIIRFTTIGIMLLMNTKMFIYKARESSLVPEGFMMAKLLQKL